MDKHKLIDTIIRALEDAKRIDCLESELALAESVSDCIQAELDDVKRAYKKLEKKYNKEKSCQRK